MILNDLSHDYNILSQARYVTDLSITSNENTKILSLQWYAKIPFFGHIVSYIRYLVCHPSMIQRQLIELKKNYESDFKASIINDLEDKQTNRNQIEQTYQRYLLIQQLFSQINQLAETKFTLELDWAGFLQDSTFTNASLALDQLETSNPDALKITRFHALLKKIDGTAKILERSSEIVAKKNVLDELGTANFVYDLKCKSIKILKIFKEAIFPNGKT